MTRRSLFITVASLALLLPLGASAQSIDDLESMTPEDRRAYFDAMSPDERRAKREEWRAQAKERWDAMSEEEREAAKDRRRQHRQKRDERNSPDSG
jgi:hypothetical protein